MAEGTAKEKVEKNDKRSFINVFLEPQKIDTVLPQFFTIYPPSIYPALSILST